MKDGLVFATLWALTWAHGVITGIAIGLEVWGP